MQSMGGNKLTETAVTGRIGIVAVRAGLGEFPPHNHTLLKDAILHAAIVAGHTALFSSSIAKNSYASLQRLHSKVTAKSELNSADSGHCSERYKGLGGAWCQLLYISSDGMRVEIGIE